MLKWIIILLLTTETQFKDTMPDYETYADYYLDVLQFEDKDYLRTEKLELTIENVKLVLEETDISFKDEVLTLILRESGNLKSKLTTEGNNLFGMRRSGKRQSTATGTIFTYAAYDTWYDSILDYQLWEQMSPPKKGESFKKYLKRRKWN